MRCDSLLLRLVIPVAVIVFICAPVSAKKSAARSGYAGYEPQSSKGQTSEPSTPGLSHDPDKAAPEGYDGGEDNIPYEAYYDSSHPLKNPDKDPGKEWERKNKQAHADGSFGALAASVDWDWRERYFNETFIVILHVTNRCKSEQPTSIFVSNVPGLTFPRQVTVPPGEDGLDVTGRVTLPSPPIPTGAPGEPPMGHVIWPPFFVAPGQTPPHQPNAVAIGGEIVAWHPEAMDIDGKFCHATRITYKPGGHIHWRPPNDGGDTGPSELAKTDPCTVWWNIGEQPDNASEQECRPKMRILAVHFMEKILPPFIEHAPGDWAWLKEFGNPRNKSIAELLAMKSQASNVAENTQW
ncbi:MAG: hypothetical protein DRR04_08750 [Gammaproteobacteria bacterium]|nr:MAG: hypothetical protein DRQ97_12440 [Gammaproteobacteria bacterium]RLA59336.1 MAG: hypothetical protein DRR04_08750 [Gammaproteobacteria bacterium]